MIHERYEGLLEADEKKDLETKAITQVDRIKSVLKWNKQPMAFFEVQQALDRMGHPIHEASVKRALTDLTGSEHEDKHGRSFAIYLKDTKKKNQYTQKSCGTYQFNPEHGQVVANAVQSDMFASVMPRV